jgi:phosphatidylglycerophosphate synthase
MKAVLVFAAMMFVALFHIQTHPFPRWGLANQLTTLRAAIVALAAGLLGESLSPAAMNAVAISGLVVTLLDGLDGQAARRTGMASPFGARFDMETDAFFIMVLAALVWRSGKAGSWILLAGLMRYLFVAAMAALPWMRRQEPPSIRRKAICVVQVVGLSLVMLPAFSPPVSSWWCALILLTLVYSFGVDTLWLWRHRE